jgi:hypothetical protein
VEPTCGLGSFVRAALEAWPQAVSAAGYELQSSYVAKAIQATEDSRAQFFCADFFTTDWTAVLGRLGADTLVVGNLPWVTNAAVGSLRGANLPAKKHVAGATGFESISGRANFDISEWMMEQMLDWCETTRVSVALLVKISVARRILKSAWSQGRKVGGWSIHRIDAQRWFGAAVDACLFTMETGRVSLLCPVHASLGGKLETTMGFAGGVVIGDIARYEEVRPLLGTNSLRWRSGVKHDCAKVMEMTRQKGILRNGFGSVVDIEEEHVFPLLKSSHLANGLSSSDRFMLVPQRRPGEPTEALQHSAPKTWEYLLSHQKALDARGSSIYRKAPRFAVFGVGDYTFSPFKVAVSGLYKEPKFVVLGEVNKKATVVDDTACFLSFPNRAEAELVANALNSDRARAFWDVFAFRDSKRPFTSEVLSKLCLAALVHEVSGTALPA